MLRTPIFFSFALLLLCHAFNAQGQTFVKWSFEKKQLTPAFDYSAPASAELSLVYEPEQTFTTGLSGSSWSLHTSGYAAQHDRKEIGVQLLASTTGKNGIIFSWEMKAEAAASRFYRIYYTTNRGVNWIPVDLTDFNCTVKGALADAVANLIVIEEADAEVHAVINFSEIHTLDNNPNFGLRVLSVPDPRNGSFVPVSGTVYNPAAAVIFDNFSIGRNSALPITVTGFSAQALPPHQVNIEWETESEEAFSHFEVQRSVDGVHFETMKQVPAKNDHLSNKYRYSDLPGSESAYLYRLRTVDMDNEGAYSATLRVRFETAGQPFLLYPNPAGATLAVSGKFFPGDVLSIADGQGKILYQSTLSEERDIYTLPVSGLPAGFYFLRIATPVSQYGISWQKL